MVEIKTNLFSNFEDGEAVRIAANYNGVASTLYRAASLVFSLPPVGILMAGREAVESWVENLQRREVAVHYPPMVPSVLVQLGRPNGVGELYKIITAASRREVTVVIEDGFISSCEINFGGSRIAAKKILLGFLSLGIPEQLNERLDIEFGPLEPEGREWTIILPRALHFTEEGRKISLLLQEQGIKTSFEGEAPPTNQWEDVLLSAPVHEFVGRNESWPSNGQGAQWVREQALAVAKEISPNATLTLI